MNHWLSGTIGAGLLLALASGANAQSSNETIKVDRPFSIKTGTLFLSDSQTKRTIGNNMTFLGVGYDFLKTPADKPIVLQGYFDYYFDKDKTVRNDGISTKTTLQNMYAIGVSARYQFVKAEENSKHLPYVGLGLGYYSSRLKQTTDFGESVDSSSQSKGGIGGKLFVGITKKGYIGEVEYNFLPKNGPVKPSGIAARVGYRF